MMKKHSACAKLNTKGFTLTELLVTFVLLSVFIVSATMIISSVMNVYYQAKGTSYGLQISEIICDRIAQELERAKPMSFQRAEPEPDEDTAAMYLGPETVEYADAEGRHAKIGVSEKDGGQYLQITYYIPAENNEEETGTVTDVWCFDKRVYMGYFIKSLRFSKASEEFLDNVICVELVLYSPQYGEYAAKRYISCYNFAGDHAGLILQVGQ